jgi:flagellar assembly factor FliW
MTLQTKAYGLVEIEEQQLLEFPQGLLGFEEYRRFALIDAHKKPFFWLQSTEDPHIAFILIKPSIFHEDYDPGISQEDLDDIGAEAAEECLVFAIVTIPESGPMTANLQGPLYISKKTLRGKQCISPRDEYRTRHDILEEMAARRE